MLFRRRQFPASSRTTISLWSLSTTTVMVSFFPIVSLAGDALSLSLQKMTSPDPWDMYRLFTRGSSSEMDLERNTFCHVGVESHEASRGRSAPAAAISKGGENPMKKWIAPGMLAFLHAALLLAVGAWAETPAKPSPAPVAKPEARQLTTQAKVMTGDFDMMLDRRVIKVLAPYSRSLYF